MIFSIFLQSGTAITLVLWNSLCWVYLHHTNRHILKTRPQLTFQRLGLAKHLLAHCWLRRVPQSLGGSWTDSISIILRLLLSCIQLFATPWTVAHQAPLSMEFFRQEYWSGLPFFIPLPNPEIKPLSCVSCTGRQILYHCATWEASILHLTLGRCWEVILRLAPKIAKISMSKLPKYLWNRIF